MRLITTMMATLLLLTMTGLTIALVLLLLLCRHLPSWVLMIIILLLLLPSIVMVLLLVILLSHTSSLCSGVSIIGGCLPVHIFHNSNRDEVAVWFPCVFIHCSLTFSLIPLPWTLMALCWLFSC
jgi:hypothetical protein